MISILSRYLFVASVQNIQLAVFHFSQCELLHRLLVMTNDTDKTQLLLIYI